MALPPFAMAEPSPLYSSTVLSVDVDDAPEVAMVPVGMPTCAVIVTLDVLDAVIDPATMPTSADVVVVDVPADVIAPVSTGVAASSTVEDVLVVATD